MRKYIFLLSFFSLAHLCRAQNLDTTNYFSPALSNIVKSLVRLEDTIVTGNTIKFKIDTSSPQLIYADLKNNKGVILYSGILKNEFVWVLTENNKGKVVSQVRYKLTEVVPLFKHVVVVGKEVEDTYTLKGYAKYYIKDGYSRTYKDGRLKSSVYYVNGKPLKIRF